MDALAEFLLTHSDYIVAGVCVVMVIVSAVGLAAHHAMADYLPDDAQDTHAQLPHLAQDPRMTEAADEVLRATNACPPPRRLHTLLRDEHRTHPSYPRQPRT
jgi:hypothetical protein